MRKYLLIALSIGLVSSVFANQVVLKNSSNRPMQVTYQYAYKNNNAAPQYGARQSKLLNKQLTLPVELGNFDYAGVVIDEVSGHRIPASYRQFPMERSCQGVTSKHKNSETLKFSGPNSDGMFKCSKGPSV